MTTAPLSLSSPTITSQGIGSGLNINSIISKLMTVESQPLNQLQKQQSTYKSELSAVGQLKSALSTFQTSMAGLADPSAFQLYKASSSDTSVFTATASSGSAAGTHSIVVSQLAKADMLGSANFSDASTTTIGSSTDNMNITVNGQTFSVAMGQTLNDLANAINSSSSNVGVSASVVEQSSGIYNLVLSSNSTGTANDISVSYTDSSSGGSVTDPLSMSTIQAGADAQLTLDGTYSITRSSNTISDAISGVTLNLVSADPSNSHTVTISTDVSGITAKAQAFVDAYNSLHTTMSKLDQGTLQGDNTLLGIEQQIRSTLDTPPTGLSSSYSYLAQIGLSIQKDGSMSLDKTTFQTALQSDFNGVAQLFGNNDQGYAYRLNSLVDQFVQTSGVLDAHTQGINALISSTQSSIDGWQTRLQQIQANYQQEFSAMDALVGTLQSTGNYLTQQLANIPKA